MKRNGGKSLQECLQEREQKAKQINGKDIMNYIIASTYARHSKLTEDEFLEAIGYSGSGKTEEEAIRISIVNLLVEMTKVLIMTRQEMDGIKSVVEVSLSATDGEKEKISETEKEINNETIKRPYRYQNGNVRHIKPKDRNNKANAF